MTTRVPVDQLSMRDTEVWYEGDPFTGTSVETLADGELREEQDYRRGVLHGWGRVIVVADGRLLEEVPYRHGVQHGVGRWWHPNGRLSREVTAQFGMVLERREYDEEGRLTAEFRADEDSVQARQARRMSEKHKDDPSYQ